jgi:hypothetical protein
MLQIISQRKQAKLLWLQERSKINGDNLNNAGHEASRHFRNKKKEYLKDKINTTGLYTQHSLVLIGYCSSL